MVLKCVVRSCFVYSSDKTHKMFRLPLLPKSIIESQRNMTEMRLALWREACGIKKNPAPHHRVCSRHFVSGKPAKLLDSDDVDWAPTQNLSGVDPGIDLNSSTKSMELEVSGNQSVSQQCIFVQPDVHSSVCSKDTVNDADIVDTDIDISSTNQAFHHDVLMLSKNSESALQDHTFNLSGMEKSSYGMQSNQEYVIHV